MKKPLSLLIVVCFFLTDIAQANPLRTFPAAREVPEAPYNVLLEIPPSLGTIEEVHAPASAPFIIHIQTIHGHYETALKIKEIIHYIKDHYGVKLLFAEGAGENLHSEFLRFIPDPAQNRKVIDMLARRGELTGTDLALLDPSIQATGIEDPDLYRESYRAFKKVIGSLSQSEVWLEQKRLAIDRQASRVFSRELRNLTDQWLQFHSGKRSFAATIRFLRKEAKESLDLDLENPFSQFEWPQLTRLILLQGLEKRLEEKKYKEEQGRLKEWLASNTLPESLFPLSFPEEKGRGENKNHPRKTAEKFLEQAFPKGFRFQDYPQITYHTAYRILEFELDATPLLEEFGKLFDELLDQRAATEEERLLIRQYKDLLLFGKLLRLELTPADWGVIKSYPVPVSMDGGLPAVFKAALHFYRLTERRDEAFLDKMRSGIRASSSTGPWILVSGGFHTERLKTLFREQGMGYAVMTPKVSGDIDSSLYHNIMMRGAHMERPSALQTARAQIRLTGDRHFIRSEMESFRQIIRDTIPGVTGVDQSAWFTDRLDSLGKTTIDLQSFPGSAKTGTTSSRERAGIKGFGPAKTGTTSSRERAGIKGFGPARTGLVRSRERTGGVLASGETKPKTRSEMREGEAGDEASSRPEVFETLEEESRRVYAERLAAWRKQSTARFAVFWGGMAVATAAAAFLTGWPAVVVPLLFLGFDAGRTFLLRLFQEEGAMFRELRYAPGIGGGIRAVPSREMMISRAMDRLIRPAQMFRSRREHARAKELVSVIEKRFFSAEKETKKHTLARPAGGSLIDIARGIAENMVREQEQKEAVRAAGEDQRSVELFEVQEGDIYFTAFGGRRLFRLEEVPSGKQPPQHSTRTFEARSFGPVSVPIEMEGRLISQRLGKRKDALGDPVTRVDGQEWALYEITKIPGWFFNENFTPSRPVPEQARPPVSQDTASDEAANMREREEAALNELLTSYTEGALSKAADSILKNTMADKKTKLDKAAARLREPFEQEAARIAKKHKIRKDHLMTELKTYQDDLRRRILNARRESEQAKSRQAEEAELTRLIAQEEAEEDARQAAEAAEKAERALREEREQLDRHFKAVMAAVRKKGEQASDPQDVFSMKEAQEHHEMVTQSRIPDNEKAGRLDDLELFLERTAQAVWHRIYKGVWKKTVKDPEFQEIKDKLEQANRLNRERKYEQAAEVYNEITIEASDLVQKGRPGLKPVVIRAAVGASKVYRHAGKFTEALDIMDGALELDPWSPYGLIERGWVLSRHSDYGQAAAQALAVLRRLPADFDTMNMAIKLRFDNLIELARKPQAVRQEIEGLKSDLKQWQGGKEERTRLLETLNDYEDKISSRSEMRSSDHYGEHPDTAHEEITRQEVKKGNWLRSPEYRLIKAMIQRTDLTPFQKTGFMVMTGLFVGSWFFLESFKFAAVPAAAGLAFAHGGPVAASITGTVLLLWLGALIRLPVLLGFGAIFRFPLQRALTANFIPFAGAFAALIAQALDLVREAQPRYEGVTFRDLKQLNQKILESLDVRYSHFSDEERERLRLLSGELVFLVLDFQNRKREEWDGKLLKVRGSKLKHSLVRAKLDNGIPILFFDTPAGLDVKKEKLRKKQSESPLFYSLDISKVLQVYYEESGKLRRPSQPLDPEQFIFPLFDDREGDFSHRPELRMPEARAGAQDRERGFLDTRALRVLLETGMGMLAVRELTRVPEHVMRDPAYGYEKILRQLIQKRIVPRPHEMKAEYQEALSAIHNKEYPRAQRILKRLEAAETLYKRFHARGFHSMDAVSILRQLRHDLKEQSRSAGRTSFDRTDDPELRKRQVKKYFQGVFSTYPDSPEWGNVETTLFTDTAGRLNMGKATFDLGFRERMEVVFESRFDERLLYFVYRVTPTDPELQSKVTQTKFILRRDADMRPLLQPGKNIVEAVEDARLLRVESGWKAVQKLVADQVDGEDIFKPGHPDFEVIYRANQSGSFSFKSKLPMLFLLGFPPNSLFSFARRWSDAFQGYIYTFVSLEDDGRAALNKEGRPDIRSFVLEKKQRRITPQAIHPETGLESRAVRSDEKQVRELIWEHIQTPAPDKQSGLSPFENLIIRSNAIGQKNFIFGKRDRRYYRALLNLGAPNSPFQISRRFDPGQEDWIYETVRLDSEGRPVSGTGRVYQFFRYDDGSLRRSNLLSRSSQEGGGFTERPAFHAGADEGAVSASRISEEGEDTFSSDPRWYSEKIRSFDADGLQVTFTFYDEAVELATPLQTPDAAENFLRQFFADEKIDHVPAFEALRQEASKTGGVVFESDSGVQILGVETMRDAVDFELRYQGKLLAEGNAYSKTPEDSRSEMRMFAGQAGAGREVLTVSAFQLPFMDIEKESIAMTGFSLGIHHPAVSGAEYRSELRNVIETYYRQHGISEHEDRTRDMFEILRNNTEGIALAVRVRDARNKKMLEQVVDTAKFLITTNRARAHYVLLVPDKDEDAEILKGKVREILLRRYPQLWRQLDNHIKIFARSEGERMTRFIDRQTSKVVWVDWLDEEGSPGRVPEALRGKQIHANRVAGGGVIDFDRESNGYGVSLLQAAMLLLQGPEESGLRALREGLYAQSGADTFTDFGQVFAALRIVSASA